MPRVLLITAHPDDETIGAGALISRTQCARVVHVTDGAPLNMSDARAAGFSTREEYATARRQEASRALGKAGLPEDATSNLGWTDQGVAFNLEDLTWEILGLIECHSPDALLTHAYEGGHPDHDSVAFACGTAYQIYSHCQAHSRMSLFEFAGYNGPNGEMRTYEFLPGRDGVQYRLRLSAREAELKREMFQAYESQARTLAQFLPARHELFRRVPGYDFTRPPHEGKLFYEHFDWGIDGKSWRKLASKALSEFRAGHKA